MSFCDWLAYWSGCYSDLSTSRYKATHWTGMFFVLSKTLGVFLVPSNLILACGALGLGLMFSKRRRIGARLLSCCMAAFLLFGFLPIGAILLLPLETRFPPWNPDAG